MLRNNAFTFHAYVAMAFIKYFKEINTLGTSIMDAEAKGQIRRTINDATQLLNLLENMSVDKTLMELNKDKHMVANVVKLRNCKAQFRRMQFCFAYNRRARAHANAGHHERALADVLKGLEFSTTPEEVANMEFLHALILVNLHRFADAKASCEKLKEHLNRSEDQPSLSGQSIFKITHEWKTETCPAMVAEVEKLWREECTGMKANSSGSAAFKSADFEGAIGKFDRAVKLLRAPQLRAVALSNRSATLLKLGRMQEAIADACECVQLRPDWTKGYERYGGALEQSGDHTAATNVYINAIKRDSATHKETLLPLLVAANRIAKVFSDKVLVRKGTVPAMQ